MLRAGWGAAEGQVEDEDEEGKVKEDEDNMRWGQDSRSASWEIWGQDWIQHQDHRVVLTVRVHPQPQAATSGVTDFTGRWTWSPQGRSITPVMIQHSAQAHGGLSSHRGQFINEKLLTPGSGAVAQGPAGG